MAVIAQDVYGVINKMMSSSSGLCGQVNREKFSVESDGDQTVAVVSFRIIGHSIRGAPLQRLHLKLEGCLDKHEILDYQLKRRHRSIELRVPVTELPESTGEIQRL